MHHFGRCCPQVAPTRVIVNDCFVKRPVPVIHPVVHLDRINIVPVPQHIVRPIRRREIIDPCGRPPRFW